MSLEISFDRHIDPFSKSYQECSKPGCGGKLMLRVETKGDGGTRTSQVCRKCGNTVPTVQVNVIKAK